MPGRQVGGRRQRGPNEWRPLGASAPVAGSVTLTAREFDAIRLVDLEGADPARAARALELSTELLSTMIRRARAKVAGALVDGKALVIEGSDPKHAVARYRCGTCGNVWVEKEPIDIEASSCPRCSGSRIIDLTTFGSDTDGVWRRSAPGR